MSTLAISPQLPTNSLAIAISPQAQTNVIEEKTKALWIVLKKNRFLTLTMTTTTARQFLIVLLLPLLLM